MKLPRRKETVGLTEDKTTTDMHTTQEVFPPRPATSYHIAISIDTFKPTDALRTVENLNGQNDIGIEEFIKTICFARS